MLCEGVIALHHGSQAVGKQQPALNILVGFQWSEGEHEVEFAFLEHRHQLLHRAVMDVEFHPRIGVHELDECLRHDGAERECHPDVQFAGKHFFQVFDVVYARVCGHHRLLGVGQQFLSGLGDKHFVAVAFKERQSYLLFEMADLLREGTLRDVKAPARLREVERFGHLEKIFQLTDVHCQ